MARPVVAASLLRLRVLLWLLYLTRVAWLVAAALLTARLQRRVLLLLRRQTLPLR